MKNQPRVNKTVNGLRVTFVPRGFTVTLDAEVRTYSANKTGRKETV